MKRNLRLEEAAEFLGTSKKSIYRLISDGELRAFRVRSSLRIPMEALEEYRRQQIAIFEEQNGTGRF